MGKSTAIRTKQSRPKLKRSRTQLNSDNADHEDNWLAAAHAQLDALENRIKNAEATLNEFMRLVNFNPPHPPAADPAFNGIVNRMDELRATLDNMEANMGAFFRFMNS